MTMLEKAARAVMALMRDDRSATAEDVARAVLMAVREPDGAMIAAGEPAMPVETQMSVAHGRAFVALVPRGEKIGPAPAFTAMIDAILEEKADDDPA